MAHCLEALSTPQLEFILTCEKVKELTQSIPQDTTNALLASVESGNGYATSISSKITLGFLAAGDAISNPVYMLWYICDGFATYALSIFCLALLPVTLSLAVGFFYATYTEESLKNEKERNTFQLASLKLAAIKEMNKRLGLPVEEPTPWPPSKKTSLTKAISASTSASLTILGIYYGLGTVLGSCGLTVASTALLSPLGLVITLSVCGILGMYFGYKYYSAIKISNNAAKHKKMLEKEFNLECKRYDEKQLQLSTPAPILFKTLLPRLRIMAKAKKIISQSTAKTRHFSFKRSVLPPRHTCCKSTLFKKNEAVRHPAASAAQTALLRKNALLRKLPLKP